MSETNPCPTCQQPVSVAFSFCPQCRSQVKCRNSDCGQPLVANTDICVYCGTPVQATTAQPARNKFKRVVKSGKYGASENMDYDLTDHAVTELAAVLAGQILNRPQQQQPYQVRPPHVQAFAAPAGLFEPPAEQEPVAAQPTEETPPPAPTNNEPQGAARFFRRDGEYLLATKKDYKGTTHAEQQRRFILLYASAYEQVFKKSVPNKDHFKAAAEKAKIIDINHFTIYLNNLCGKYLSESSEGFFVNDDGTPEIKRIIAEMDNPSTQAGYAYSDKTPTNTTEKYRLSAKDKELFHGWAKEDVALGGLDILDIKTGRDYALLAYWLLITHLKKRDKFRWNEAWEYFHKKYDAIGTTPNAFSKAVTGDEKGEFFRKSGEAYFLSSEAIALVEKWVSGEAKPGSGDKKKE